MANSNWYGSPIKIFEYGIMGKAIIAPDNQPVNEVVSANEEALLVPPEVEPLAQAMRRMLDDPAGRVNMGVRSQQKIFTHYTWAHNASQVLGKKSLL